MQRQNPPGMDQVNQFGGGEFLNREKEFRQLDHWLEHALKHLGRPCLLLGRRGIGKSALLGEWLKRRAPELSAAAVPFFYSFRPYALEASIFARSYFSSFILQYIQRRLPRGREAVPQSTSWDNLRQLCEQAGSPSLLELIDAVEESHQARDLANLLNLVISAPHWIAKFERLTIPVILDHAEFMQRVNTEGAAHPLWPHFQSIYNMPSAPHLFCGSRHSLKAALPELFSEFTSARIIEIGELDIADSMALLKMLADNDGIKISIDVLEQVAAQLKGCPFYLHAFMDRARTNDRDVHNLPQAQKLYAEEVIEGTIHWYWRSILQTHFPSIHLRRSVLKLCYDLLNKNNPAFNLRAVSRRLGLEETDFNGLLQALQLAGILAESFGNVQLAGDPILHDVITAMYWKDIENLPPEGVIQRIVQQRLIAHSRMMQRQPSQQLLGSLQCLINSFNGQHALREMLHYRTASQKNGGEELPRQREETLMRMPVIIGTICENVLEPSATPLPADDGPPPYLISFGFYDAKYAPGYQMIWLTVVYAALETVTSEDVQLALKIKTDTERRFETRVQYLWIVARETFTAEAQELAERNRIYTSNLDMVQRLTNHLMRAQAVTPRPEAEAGVAAGAGADASALGTSETSVTPNRISATEFEIEIPIAPDLESLAAQSLEQVAEMARWDPAQIGKLKMALLEAVLQVVHYQTRNGEQRVRVKYEILDDRLNLTVQNVFPIAEGVLRGDQQKKMENGVKLMRKLVDNLDVQKVAGGCRIQLTAARPKPERSPSSSLGG